MTKSIEYLREESFIKSSDELVYHGFFKRIGGVSTFPYDSLNCGIGSKDSQDNIQQNRTLVAEQAGLKPQNLLSVYQMHSADVVEVSAPWTDRPKADAMVTDKAGIGLGVLTADCAPVLLVGKKKNGAPVIAAAHAGSKGALSGVLDNTIKAMQDLGSLQSEIRACVGPCISRISYEVSESFSAPFMEEDDESERFFHASAKAGHLQFDLSGYCAWRLFRASIKNVSLLDVDTYKDENGFFSYRRTTHRKEEDYGRQVSVISIRG